MVLVLVSRSTVILVLIRVQRVEGRRCGSGAEDIVEGILIRYILSPSINHCLIASKVVVVVIISCQALNAVHKDLLIPMVTISI